MTGATTINQVFDLKSWIDAKITGKSFGATVKSKWQEKQKKAGT
jgi:hypothetical protein